MMTVSFDGVPASISALGDVAAAVGEGPVWRADEQALEWIDMARGVLHRTSCASGSTSSITLPWPMGAVVPRRSGGWVAATWMGFALLAADGEVERNEAFLLPEQRMNDAACDPQGRLVAGSTAREFAQGAGELHLLRPDGSHDVIVAGLSLPNGMGWSPDGTTFYLADSLDRVILAFTVDVTTGRLRGCRAIRRFGVDDGQPDGLCVDHEGCVWVALWDGGAIVRLSPDGTELARVAVPVSRPTSCAFGGPDRDILFVTTAGASQHAAPLDGRLLAIRGLGPTGVPRTFFDG